MTDAATHRVFNQVPDLAHYNLFDRDPMLRAALERLGGGWHADTLRQFGARLGEPEVQQWAADANRHTPELHTHSRTGERIDVVEFHPGWHALLGLLRSQQLQALPFAQPRAGAWAARTAGYFLQAQVESGSLCPPTMTFASIPVLRKEAALFAELEPRLYATGHDARDLPWRDKTAIMVGMGMTEKQGGSDVRANTTVARPLHGVGGEGRGAEYALTGHKWFFSAPMCDAHLVVARMGAEDGPLSCFFVPRFRDDGSRNAVQIQRLKDKLGNRSNASSEVEFRDATGILIGEEGRGIPTIIEMATSTRLDCVIGSAAILRAAFVQALHHTRHRSAFGRLLCDQPLMRNVLADLALESEAATLLMMELGHAFAHADEDPLAAAWKRVVTPAAKFWVCKRTLEATGEAMEVWGGNGYVEEGPMARLYREAPVNSIWEGSGNIMCLDVLRALQRNPDDGARLLQDLSRRAGGHPAVRAELASLQAMLREPADQLEANARRFAQGLVLTAQAALMLAHADHENAELFVASRLGRQHGRVFGTLDADADALARVASRGFEG